MKLKLFMFASSNSTETRMLVFLMDGTQSHEPTVSYASVFFRVASDATHMFCFPSNMFCVDIPVRKNGFANKNRKRGD